jgi:hypothetical protein
MASFHGLWSVGGLAGATLGGVVAAQRVALGPHMLAVAALALIGLALAARWLMPDTGSGTGESGPSFALPPRALLLLGAVAFGVLFCEGAIADWGAVYLRAGPVLLTTLDVPLQAPLPPRRAPPLRRFVDRGRIIITNMRAGIQAPRHAAQPALPRLSIVALHDMLRCKLCQTILAFAMDTPGHVHQKE